MISKRGQVTIFIIIGIVIVGLVVLGIMIYPQIKTNLGLEETSPALFIQTCMENKLKETVQKVSLQGGSVSPILFTLYNNGKVEYLCYTNEYYKLGIVQQPMLKSHIQTEIKKDIEQEAKDCFDSLEKNYKSKGYDVNLKKPTNAINVALLPKRVVANFNYTLTLTKTNTQRYESFVVVLNNNLYELVGIAESILEWEATYGDADTGAYMTYYNDLKVEKDTTKSDGTKIYIITDRNTENKFQFASRSKVLPPGH
jgi:hypothetical protein